MMVSDDFEKLCPCSSGHFYANCCKKFHEGAFAETALELMRSRYSAYALNRSDYIIQTTHPKKRGAQCDRESIEAFSKNTHFQRLEILDAQRVGSYATVTFRAHLLQESKDVSFTEKSSFEKIKGRWFYLDGVMER